MRYIFSEINAEMVVYDKWSSMLVLVLNYARSVLSSDFAMVLMDPTTANLFSLFMLKLIRASVEQNQEMVHGIIDSPPHASHSPPTLVDISLYSIFFFFFTHRILMILTGLPA